MKKQLLAASVGIAVMTACTDTEESNAPDNVEDGEDMDVPDDEDEMEDEAEETQNDLEQDSTLLASEADGDFQLELYQTEEEPGVFRAELRYTGSEEEMEIFHFQNVINFHLEQEGEEVGGVPFVDDGSGETSTILRENESIEDSVSEDTIDNVEAAPGEEYTLVAEPYFHTEEDQDLEEEEAITSPRVEAEVTFSDD